MDIHDYSEDDSFCAECAGSNYSSSSAAYSTCNSTRSGSPESHHNPTENRLNIVAIPRLLPFDSATNASFSPFCIQCLGDAEANRHQVEATIYSVGAAVQMNFGDQITSWSEFLARITQPGPSLSRKQSPISIDHVLSATNFHYFDNYVRTQRFATMLPGFDLLNTASRNCTSSPWKTIVCSMLHHAPFCTGTAAHFLVGPQQLHYEDCCYAEKKANVLLVSVQVFLQKFATEVRKIGLNPMERYFLMAVILLEPVESTTPDITLAILHRHYTDALMYAIAQRCGPDHWKRMKVYMKLEQFFDLLKPITRLTRIYFHPQSCPLSFASFVQTLKTLNCTWSPR